MIIDQLVKFVLNILEEINEKPVIIDYDHRILVKVYINLVKKFNKY